MNKPIQLISALGIGMVFILSPITTHAENTEQRIADLDKQVTELQERDAALQERIAALQKRIATLEPIPEQNEDPSKSSNPGTTGDWTIRANWLSLERGMTKKQVLQLLGEPKMARAMPYGHNWFYQSGYTMFDHMGRLEKWSEPL